MSKDQRVIETDVWCHFEVITFVKVNVSYDGYYGGCADSVSQWAHA